MKVYIVHSPVDDHPDSPMVEIESAYLDRSKALAERRRLNRKAKCSAKKGDSVWEIKELEVIE